MDSEKLENKAPNLRSAYELLGVDNIFDLQKRYTEEDQKLMKSNSWDYDNSDLVTNKVKHILEQVDASGLTEEEQEWRNEILWFWYHHAISCAIWLKQDKAAAQGYATKALELQGDDHPNQITRLLYLLVNDRYEEAKEWATNVKDEIEKETAKDIIEEWPSVKFQES